MSGFYLHHLLRIAVAAVTLFAWLKGGWPERIGATANLAATVVVFVLIRELGRDGFGLSLLVIDGLLGLVFLALAVRYTSLWLGGAMLLQAAQFSLHAFYYVGARPMDLLFAVVNNTVSWGVLACILAGTIAAWRGAGRSEI